jgi:formate/nitrite transporter FocA (FNT family)
MVLIFLLSQLTTIELDKSKSGGSLMNFFNNFFISVFGGIAIGIGSLIFLNLGGVAGMVGFSIGLYLILWFHLNLYTGKIGYVTKRTIGSTFLILLGNLIGCLLMLIFPPAPAAVALMATKLATPWYLVFIKSIICGILIYAAVEQYKQGKEYAPIIAVPAFIACGAEHCIADFCFALLAGPSLSFIPFFLLVVAGNSIGSIIFRFVTKT